MTASGGFAVQIEGKMIDALVLLQAQRMIERMR